MLFIIHAECEASAASSRHLEVAVTPDTLDRLDGVLPFQIGTGFEFPPARAELRLDHDERVRGLVVGEHVGGRLREGHRVFRVKLTAEMVFNY